MAQPHLNIVGNRRTHLVDVAIITIADDMVTCLARVTVTPGEARRLAQSLLDNAAWAEARLALSSDGLPQENI